jgi:hypothetical protein
MIKKRLNGPRNFDSCHSWPGSPCGPPLEWYADEDDHRENRCDRKQDQEICPPRQSAYQGVLTPWWRPQNQVPITHGLRPSVRSCMANAPVQARWASARRAGQTPPDPPAVACNRWLDCPLPICSCSLDHPLHASRPSWRCRARNDAAKTTDPGALTLAGDWLQPRRPGPTVRALRRETRLSLSRHLTRVPGAPWPSLQTETPTRASQRPSVGKVPSSNWPLFWAQHDRSPFTAHRSHEASHRF